MKPLNASIAHIPLPDRLRHRPVTDTGFPVPWFAATRDGKPDLRFVDPAKLERAIGGDLCWICGNCVGRWKAFVAGPLSAITRTSAEPPSHRSCAEYAVQACPLLARPRMKLNRADMPANAKPPPGIFIERNPGVALVWITHGYRVSPGPLLHMGEPTEIIAYTEGRLATRAELDESITQGLPALAKIATDDDAKRELVALMEITGSLFRAKLKLATAPPP